MKTPTQVVALPDAIYSLYKDSGFSMAGAVAFGFVVSLFPFCIFIGALAGLFGGEQLAELAVTHLFEAAPPAVAEVLAPEVKAVMAGGRFDLLTFGGFLSLFFATSAMEYLRAALNTSYRVREDRSYPWCLMQSALFVIASAIGMLVLTWGVLVGPDFAARFKPQWLLWLKQNDWASWLTRYGIVSAVLGVQLLAYHLWLVAGPRRIADIWPGVALSVLLLILAAQLFAYYLGLSDYSRFYAGLSQIMVSLVFFQITAFVIMLGAEFNRGISELKVLRAQGASAVGMNENNV